MIDKNGLTQRAILEHELSKKSLSASARARVRSQLWEAPLSAAAQVVWDWFWQLNRTRVEHQSISYQEVLAWSRHTGNDLPPLVLEMIYAMDAAYRRAVQTFSAAGGETMFPADPSEMLTMLRSRISKKR